MGIPENLLKLRKREGLSQAGLAKKAGVAQQLISQLERGENLTTKKLPEIARALNATLLDIDPSLRDAISAGTAANEIGEIYERLKDHPDWQAYLLDQARQLEQRVIPKEAQPARKAGGGK
jgi:transcriptional regulator with XRE-family HTH domain